jgi:hypothetical protein
MDPRRREIRNDSGKAKTESVELDSVPCLLDD